MALQNKLGIIDSAELARAEEKISKIKAVELYENNIVAEIEVGKFLGLAKIHKFLFGEIYNFAGKIRTVNIAKGNFRFAPVMYLGLHYNILMICLNQPMMKLLKNMWRLRFCLKVL